MKNLPSHLCQSAAPCLGRRLSAALAVGLSGLLWQTVQAQFALPIYEPFPGTYTNTGVPITVNGVAWPGTGLRQENIPSTVVWTWGGTGNGNMTNIGAAALTYPGLYQTNGSVGLYISDYNVTGARSAGIQLATVSNGTIYASFLLNVQTWPTNVNRLVCEMNSVVGLGGSDLWGFLISTTNAASGISNRVYVVKHGSATGIVTSNVPPEAPSITAGTTHLIVLRYTFNPAQTNDDELDLWMDPGSLGVAEPDVPAPAMTTTNGTDTTAFSMFGLYQQNGTTDAGLTYFFDDFVLAGLWLR